MIKIELNYSLRAHILEPVYRKLLPKVFDDGMMIRMVAPIEIFAAKGNALINRAAARDLYDWGNMMQEEEYMDRFISKEYMPELLFDDKEIVERIQRHPMALWKCR